mmetsp:Transcript_414/g.1691  ORF Transcript_414/g.1691 Transcript_414/m.1691 type:complete len:303 (-) Transcript_414:606-1514(-)
MREEFPGACGAIASHILEATTSSAGSVIALAPSCPSRTTSDASSSDEPTRAQRKNGVASSPNVPATHSLRPLGLSNLTHVTSTSSPTTGTGILATTRSESARMSTASGAPSTAATTAAPEGCASTLVTAGAFTGIRGACPVTIASSSSWDGGSTGVDSCALASSSPSSRRNRRTAPSPPPEASRSIFFGFRSPFAAPSPSSSSSSGSGTAVAHETNARCPKRKLWMSHDPCIKGTVVGRLDARSLWSRSAVTSRLLPRGHTRSVTTAQQCPRRNAGWSTSRRAPCSWSVPTGSFGSRSVRTT